MVVRFFGNVSLAPPVTFQFADKVHAVSEDENPLVFEILFNPRDARKQILVNVRVHEYAVLAE